MNADTLDRLVDDELTRQERALAVSALGDRPEDWRRVAEAFLERQALRRALTPAAPTAVRRARPAMAAAALLLAFAAGLLWPGRDAATPPLAAERPRPAPATPTELAPAEALPPAGFAEPLFRVSLDGGLVRYSTAEALPAFVVEALQESGHRVEVTTRSLTVPTGGEPLEVPLTETRITPRYNFQL